ncbi:MAG: TetR/AcrR family transcriptional regulator [Spirochaetales bacterium]|jgi:AcrR family transcriptional regulator|nr:TetR/AcrR family transcriptional regulator [Spirochaetales bacterium]
MSREKIIEAAETAFSKKGFHNTSMDVIALNAGVAKGTLYYNFPTKAALFLAVIDAGMSYLTGAINAEIEKDEPSLRQVENIVRIHIDIFLEHPRIAKIMFNEISAGLDKEIQNHIIELRSRYENYLLEIIKLGIREGVVRNLNTALLTNTIFNLLNSAANYAADNPQVVKSEELQEFLRIMLFRGIFIGEKE